MPVKYELLSNSNNNPEAHRGTIVYLSTKYDYGLSNDDTRSTGVEHVSVTFKEDGDYPFFTHPRHMLKEIKD